MKTSNRQAILRLFAMAMFIGFALSGKAQAFDGDDDF